MARFVKVVKKSRLPENRGTYVEIGGNRIALFNLGGEIYAIGDTCTHQGGSLSQGRLRGGEVECPWHGSLFSIETGEAVSPPARDKVVSYRVRLTDDDVVEVEI